jgi:uncharacterized protein YjbI with pentapeptide repeats
MSDEKKGRLWGRKASFTDGRFERFDFFYSDFNHPIFNGAAFVDCVFDESILDDVRTCNCTFKNCSFRGGGLGDAPIGAPAGRFEDCEFLNCDFRGGLFSRPAFVNCLFKDCKWKEVDFRASSFKNCKFVGKLSELTFRAASQNPAATCAPQGCA